MRERTVIGKLRGRATRDGAGVRLTRIFGFGETERLDPFLLLDAFGSDDPDDYLPGFPWHPHRGIETVTYMRSGQVRHRDSLGGGGVIGPGDLQWMTAGSGIIHEEMPLRSPQGVHGFQLWVNLPRAEKMRDPAYRGVTADAVPELPCEGGTVKVLAGRFGSAEGPVAGLARAPMHLDVGLEPGGAVELALISDHNAFAYLYEGELVRAGEGADQQAPGASAGDCLLFSEGERLRIVAGSSGARFIFAAALPLREPVAWAGPIVMNTQSELELAFREYEEGTFVKKSGGPS